MTIFFWHRSCDQCFPSAMVSRTFDEVQKQNALTVGVHAACHCHMPLPHATHAHGTVFSEWVSLEDMGPPVKSLWCFLRPHPHRRTSFANPYLPKRRASPSSTITYAALCSPRCKMLLFVPCPVGCLRRTVSFSGSCDFILGDFARSFSYIYNIHIHVFRSSLAFRRH